MNASKKYRNVFPERLRQALTIKDMTQFDLAEKLKIKPAAVNHFVCGRRSPSLENLGRIADAVGVSADYLLGRTDAPGLHGPAAADLTAVAAGLSNRDLTTVITLAKSLSSSGKK